MFKAPLSSQDAASTACIRELRGHVARLEAQVADIAENALEVVKELRERVDRLEMQMRAPRVCQHEPLSVESPAPFRGVSFQLVIRGSGYQGTLDSVSVCSLCRCIYVPKE